MLIGIDIDEDGEEFIEEALVANCSLTFVDVSGA
jgi:hypothetical protein